MATLIGVFLFDETGQFIEGYYLVGSLSEAFLQQDAHGTIIYDPRLTWNTEAIIKQYGGTGVQSKAGHAFIKERMRLEDAVYGGEMSGHHYFKYFGYCDSGMIPWLLVAALMITNKQPMSQLVSQRMRLFPASGEINRVLIDPEPAIQAVVEHYGPLAIGIIESAGSVCVLPIGDSICASRISNG